MRDKPCFPLRRPLNAGTARAQFAEWYRSCRAGQALQALESAYLRQALRLCYGQRFLQVGALGWEDAYWERDCFSRAWVVNGEQGPVAADRCLIGRADELPVDSDSIDVVLLPHVLEFESDQHQVLREAERVLKPEGQLYVLGFNPFSLFSAWRYLSLGALGQAPGSGRFVSSWRLMDWLRLLKFEAELTARFSIASRGYRAKPGAGAPLGCPWFATGYAIRAIKRRYRLIPLGRRTILRPRLAPQSVVGPTTREGVYD